jgi:hypothetical protein
MLGGTCCPRIRIGRKERNGAEMWLSMRGLEEKIEEGGRMDAEIG